MRYRLVQHHLTVIRTHWWKDQDDPQHREKSYWIDGPGVYRPATDIEIAIWRDVVERAIQVVRPFAEPVNVTEMGGTPEEALRKEFGAE